MTTKNPCTLCGKPGIPGIIKGAGKCQYHWNVGVYGQAWADDALTFALYEHYAAQRLGYNFTVDTREEWERSGRADRARAHYHLTGHFPGEYIGEQETSA